MYCKILLLDNPEVLTSDKLFNPYPLISLIERSTVSNLDELMLILLVFEVIAFDWDVVIPVFAVLVATSDFIEFSDESTTLNLVLTVLNDVSIILNEASIFSKSLATIHLELALSYLKIKLLLIPVLSTLLNDSIAWFVIDETVPVIFPVTFPTTLPVKSPIIPEFVPWTFNLPSFTSNNSLGVDVPIPTLFK